MYHIDVNGEDKAVSEQGIAKHLSSMGYNVSGISPDGTSLILNDEKGQFTRPIPALINQVAQKSDGPWPGGFLKGALPNPGVSDASRLDDNATMSAELHNAAFDDVGKQNYLNKRLTENGFNSPQVIGMGDEWHFYNPYRNKWVQLTQQPMLGNKAGLINAGMNAAPLAAGVFGLGEAGPIGAALGGASGEALKQGATEYLDPDYAQQMHNPTHGHPFMDVAEEGVKQGLGGLGAYGIGKVAPAIPGLMSKVLSGTGEIVGGLGGAVADTAGSIANKAGAEEGLGSTAAKVAENTIGTALTPGGQAADLAGFIAELPKVAVGSTAKAMKFVSEHPWTKPLFGSEETPANFGEIADELMKPRPASTQSLGSKIQGFGDSVSELFGGSPAKQASQSEAKTVLGNAVSLMKARSKYLADPANLEAEEMARQTGNQIADQASSEAMSSAANAGLSEEDLLQGVGSSARENATDSLPDNFGNYMANKLRWDTIKQMSRGDMQSNIGDKLGSGFDIAARGGQSITNAMSGLGTAALRGGQLGGNVARVGGGAAQLAGRVAEPFELPGLIRYGAEPKIGDALDQWRKKNQKMLP